jgi:hypothetical protein
VLSDIGQDNPAESGERAASEDEHCYMDLNLQNRLYTGVAHLADRLNTQGLRVTLSWLVGHSLPRLTGVPILRYCQVTPQIYIGAQIGALGKRRLSSRGFTASVNLQSEFDDAAHGLALAEYCYLPTDDGHASTVAQLEAGVAFIRRVVEGGGKVYIHCHGGVGRAPSLAAAYLMRQGRSLDEALTLIRATRPFICFSPEQLDRLKNFR